MARINTNVGAIVANTNLAKSQKSLGISLQRLSSGLRINTGADDPAGLIASETLRSEIQGISTAIVGFAVFRQATRAAAKISPVPSPVPCGPGRERDCCCRPRWPNSPG